MAKMLSMPEAFERATGSRPHTTSCWRWWRRGVKGVKLETWLVGGRRKTTVAAVREFVAATTEAANRELEALDPEKKPSVNTNTRQHQKTKLALFKELGIDPASVSTQATAAGA